MPIVGQTMAAGDRDRLVTIEQMTESQAGSGLPVENWSTLCRAWMSKEDVSGREQFRAGQLAAPFNTTWTVGYRSDMDPDLVDVAKTRRLIYQGRQYDIVSASQINRKEGVELRTLARMG